METTLFVIEPEPISLAIFLIATSIGLVLMYFELK